MRIDDMFSGDNLVNDLDRIVDQDIQEVEMMGYGLDDPEMMGKVFGRLFKRIGSRIAKRRAGKKGLIKKIISRIKRRKRALARATKTRKGYGLSVETPEGTASIGPGGLDYTDREKMIKSGLIIKEDVIGTGIMEQITKNPLLLAIPAGLFLMMAMKKKQG